MPAHGKTYPLLGQAKTLANEAAFRNWLTASRNLTRRSLGDVVSRTRRVVDWMDILAPESDAEAIFRLSQDQRFEECTDNVKSQLKRATLLYREFSQLQKGK